MNSLFPKIWRGTYWSRNSTGSPHQPLDSAVDPGAGHGTSSHPACPLRTVTCPPSSGPDGQAPASSPSVPPRAQSWEQCVLWAQRDSGDNNTGARLASGGRLRPGQARTDHSGTACFGVGWRRSACEARSWLFPTLPASHGDRAAGFSRGVTPSRTVRLFLSSKL